jgi:hypothetical protein
MSDSPARVRSAARAGVTVLILVAVSVAAVRAQLPGDADCNGSVTFSDLTAVVEALFNPTSCIDTDANHDSRVSAPDIAPVLIAVAMSNATTPSGTPNATTPTPTATTAASTDGPEVTFVGLVNADGCAACDVPNCLCLGTPTRTPEIDAQGRQVFETSFGTGFLLVVEGRPGRSGFPVGTFVPAPIPDSAVRPDLQVLSDHALGDGNPGICLNDGVPAINPLSFENRAGVTDAMIDVACRFNVLHPTVPCTLDRFGDASMVTPGDPPPGSRQFCLPITNVLAFPVATETTMAVRLLDTEGAVGAAREIVVRVRAP